jgi:hypothetical protein
MKILLPTVHNFFCLQLQFMCEPARDCCLAWDEASIHPKFEMLPSDDWSGLPTIPTNKMKVLSIDEVDGETNEDDSSVCSAGDLDDIDLEQCDVDIQYAEDEVSSSIKKVYLDDYKKDDCDNKDKSIKGEELSSHICVFQLKGTNEKLVWFTI